MNIKKRFLKTISIILCIAMLSVLFTVSAFAKTFSDVENDEAVSWAKDSINEMTERGYIKGYEDGTFRPTRAVSKVETLILMSRILGVGDNEFSQTVSWADQTYSTTVNAINTAYIHELCFLMYFGVIDVTDLRDYASSANANTTLQRWQAAYLMTKLAGKDEEAKNTTLDQNVYADFESIPAAARGYVAVATKMGLMNGMGNDDGKPVFSPNTEVTRAQMATLLNRMFKSMNRSFITGEVISTSYSDSTLIVKSEGKNITVAAGDNTLIKINGENAKFTHLTDKSAVMVTYTFDEPRLIETVPAEDSIPISGIIVQTSNGAGGEKITIKDPEDDTNKVTYSVLSGCKYLRNGSKSTFADLKSGDYVELTVSGGKITECRVESKTISYDASYEGIIENSGMTYVDAVDEDGKSYTYPLSSKGCTIIRNNSTVDIRDLAVGDSISVSVEYGKIKKISAKSVVKKAKGTITEIVLSATPSITFKIDGEETKFPMTTTTQIIVNSQLGSIYDLRPGNVANISIDGSNLASVDTTSTSSSGKTSVQGKVTAVNSTLKVITVANDNGGTDTVYYNTQTTFLKGSTGKTGYAKDIVVGSSINATGVDTTGYFVATIIIAD